MDITKTRAQLVTRAAQKLGLIGSGQSLDGDDQALINSVVDAALADLAERGVYYVGNEDAIDIAPFEHLAVCLANAVAEDFGKQMDPGKVSFAENRLRTIAASQPTYETQKTEYF